MTDPVIPSPQVALTLKDKITQPWYDFLRRLTGGSTTDDHPLELTVNETMGYVWDGGENPLATFEFTSDDPGALGPLFTAYHNSVSPAAEDAVGGS